MMCQSCLTAMQRADHADYRDGCLGCTVRKLAHMEHDDRQRYLDRVQHLCGFEQRRELVQMVREEHARIKKLRATA